MFTFRNILRCKSTMFQAILDNVLSQLYVNAFYSSTTARRLTSPTWGPPPPCKQALGLF